MVAQQDLAGGLAAVLGEVALDDRVGGEPGGVQSGSPTGGPVGAGAHVDGAGDRADAAAAALDQDVGDLASAGEVVGVGVEDLLGTRQRPADERDRQPDGREVVGESIVAVVGDDDRAVDVPATQVAQRPVHLLARLGDQQHDLQVALGEHLGHDVQGAGEERVGEDPLVRLRHDHRDRVGPARHQRAGGRVGEIAQRLHGLGDGLGGLRRDT